MLSQLEAWIWPRCFSQPPSLLSDLASLGSQLLRAFVNKEALDFSDAESLTPQQEPKSKLKLKLQEGAGGWSRVHSAAGLRMHCARMNARNEGRERTQGVLNVQPNALPCSTVTSRRICAVQEWDISDVPDPEGTREYPTQFSRFQSVVKISLLIAENHGTHTKMRCRYAVRRLALGLLANGPDSSVG